MLCKAMLFSSDQKVFPSDPKVYKNHRYSSKICKKVSESTFVLK